MVRKSNFQVSKITIEEFKKLGFKTKKDGLSFISNNHIRKGRNESKKSYIKRVKDAYIPEGYARFPEYTNPPTRLIKINTPTYKRYMKRRQEDAEQQVVNNCLDILRPHRKVNPKTGITSQKSNVDTNNNIVEIFDNQIVKCLNTNIELLIQKNNDILGEFLFKRSNIKIAWVKIPDDAGISGNPFFHINDNEWTETFNDIKENGYDEYDDNGEFIEHKDLEDLNVSFITVSLEQNGEPITTIDEINNKVSQQFASIKYLYCLVEYNTLVANQENMNFNDFVGRLRAYNPTVNQQFHRMTQVSTTNFKQCIYESYYYMYVDDEKTISSNQKNINKMLELENEDIKQYVKNGELLNFLLRKSKDHKEDMYVEFYDNDNIGFKITQNDEIIEIKNKDEFTNKKVFLYDNQHVAPKKYNTETKKDNTTKTKKSNTFTLRPQKLKGKQRECEIYGYDAETFTDDKYNANAFCICLSNDKKFYGINCITEFCDYLDSIKTEIDISKTHAKKSIKQILIYGFNNSRFDNILVFNELLKRNRTTKYLIDNNSVKYIKYHNIRFYDLSLYYSGTLDDVSKSFKLKLEKGIYPYKFASEKTLNYIGNVPDKGFWKKSEQRKEYIKTFGNSFNMKEYTEKYCLIDAKLAQQIAMKHIENSYGEINGQKYDVRTCSTSAGIALKIFNQVFQKDTLYSSPDDIQKFERDAYKGGRTEVFKKYFKITEKPLKHIDVNSSYPYAMTFKMPKKYIKTIKVNEIKVTHNVLIDYNLYHAKGTYKGNNNNYIPNILQRSNKGDIIGCKDFDYGYYWGIELKEAIKSDNDVYVNQIIEYEGDYIFKEFAEYFYEQRLKDKEDNPAKANFDKTCMNSLYGKCGQKTKINNAICEDMYEISKILNNKDNKMESFEILNDNVLLKYRSDKDDDNSIGHLVRFASYICAIGRTNLNELMRIIGYEHIYYCDTDSIFTDGEIPESYIDKTKLGKWKLENEIKEAIFLAPKSYMFKTIDDNVKCKGKGHRNNDLKSEFYQKVLDGEKIEIENDAMFFRSLNGVQIKSQIRTLQHVYNKRIWIDNESKPFQNMDEWNK